MGGGETDIMGGGGVCEKENILSLNLFYGNFFIIVNDDDDDDGDDDDYFPTFLNLCCFPPPSGLNLSFGIERLVPLIPNLRINGCGSPQSPFSLLQYLWNVI